MSLVSQSPTLRVLSESVRQQRLRLTASVALALVSAAAGITAPLLISRLVTALARHSSVLPTAVELAACALTGAFAGGWSAYLLSAVGERAIADVRIALARHTVRLPLALIRRFGTGDLVSRLGTDAAQLRAITDTAVTALPVSAVMVVAYLTVMGILDWVMLLVTVGTFAVASVAIRAFLAGTRQGAREQQVALGDLAQSAQSVFTMVSTIKAFCAEASAVEPLERQADVAAAAATRTARAQAAISPLMGLGQQVAIVGVLAVGGARLTSGSISVAHFLAFLMYLFQLVNPLMTLAQGAGRIQVGRATAARLDQVLDAEPEPLGVGTVPEVPANAPALRLSDVEVTLAGKPVLRQLSLEVPRTGIVAIVGPSGAGKTTLFNLVERFVEPAEGRVELLGSELTRWPLGEARRRIALVEQGSTILDASIRQNLWLLRDGEPPQERLFEALRSVGLDHTVRSLPDGLDTRLGREVRMSGGELQRLAIARALLSDAEILLLDEPSAHLDGANETRLAELLERLGRERAIVVVTHRRATISATQSIAVMEGGRIVDVGDHATLLTTSALYRKLVQDQVETDVDTAADTEAAQLQKQGV